MGNEIKIEEDLCLSCVTDKETCFLAQGMAITYACVSYKKRITYTAEDLSNCCNAPIMENTDICSQCKEHCETKKDD